MSAPRVLRRYLLFQVPGWIIVAALCGLATRWPGLSPVTASVLFAAWVAKDLLLYPWLRHGYAPGGGEAPGFTTLILTMLFLGGVQLISVGILGQYLGRIYEETKMRPTFLVKEVRGGAPRPPGSGDAG